MAEMVALGVRIFTDDGAGVQDAALMRRALEYASDLGAQSSPTTVRKPSLAGLGCVNEGDLSSLLGLPGRPAVSEEVMVLRDLALARLTGARLHLLHLSTAGARWPPCAWPRRPGTNVTAEATPHHLALDRRDALATYDTVFKVNPPLRSGGRRGRPAPGPLRRDDRCRGHRTMPPTPPEAKQVAFCDAAPRHDRAGDVPGRGPRGPGRG